MACSASAETMGRQLPLHSMRPSVFSLINATTFTSEILEIIVSVKWTGKELLQHLPVPATARQASGATAEMVGRQLPPAYTVHTFCWTATVIFMLLMSPVFVSFAWIAVIM